MQIRLTCDRAGRNWEEHEGDIVDLPHDEALRVLASNQAERVTPEPQPIPALVGTPAGADFNTNNQKQLRRGRR